MIMASIPENEQERLAALRALDILDTPPEERFDRITRLVSDIFRVPIAYVAMVDANRQWMKSTCGWDTTETSRDISFCGHTILQDSALVIPDALKDPRFADNPMVTNKPHVRFYAGHPVRAMGENVGTLCLVAHQPREITPQELSMLEEFAAMVEHELSMLDVIHVQRELINTKEALLESRKHLAKELEEATDYACSLLPPRLNSRVKTAWKFEPSTELGGDFFSYGWIDPDHFGVYLIDVCGHGVGAALLSISVVNLLRSQSLSGVDMREPGEVLTRLNEMFPMESNGDKYFTAWYGVYQARTRRLRYASGGHPPAVLLHGPSAEAAQMAWLTGGGLAVGSMPDSDYATREIEVDPFNRLYVFSDGTYEVETGNGGMLTLSEFGDILEKHGKTEQDDDVLNTYEHILALNGAGPLDDDFSLVRVEFAGKE